MEPIVLRCHLPPEARPGVYWPRHGRAYVLVHHDLHPHEERSVIAHELAHHRRGGIDWPGMPDDWGAVVAREEWLTDRDAARMLIPEPELSAWVEERLVDETVGIGPRDVADAFGVTERIAVAALENLTRWERGGRHT